MVQSTMAEFRKNIKKSADDIDVLFYSRQVLYDARKQTNTVLGAFKALSKKSPENKNFADGIGKLEKSVIQIDKKIEFIEFMADKYFTKRGQ